MQIGLQSPGLAKRAWQLSLLFIFLASVGLGSLAFLPGSASACSNTSHCYGIAEWEVGSPSGFNGGNVIVRSKCMTASDWTSKFIDNEMWVSKGGYWVEAGLTYGAPWGPNNDFFWADNRPNYGYAQHNYLYANWGDGLYYGIDIHYVGNKEWEADSGYYTGNLSVENFSAPAYTLQAGEEITSESPDTFGETQSMKYYDLKGSLHSNWASETSHATLYENGGAYVGWVNLWNQIQDGIGAMC